MEVLLVDDQAARSPLTGRQAAKVFPIGNTSFGPSFGHAACRNICIFVDAGGFMKLALPMLAALAFAAGAACAADKKPGFDALDKNNDGFLSRVEAAGNKTLLKGFDAADKNNDAKVSRAEYLAATTKQTARKAVNKPAEPDPGFNALDKNNDGFLSRREARGNPYLKNEFKSADSNHDRKLSRAEYLAVMAKRDVKTGGAKIGQALDKPAGAGSSR
jgi:Ca2+-binding EF-hand superfamily protein